MLHTPQPLPRRYPGTPSYVSTTGGYVELSGEIAATFQVHFFLSLHCRWVVLHTTVCILSIEIASKGGADQM